MLTKKILANARKKIAPTNVGKKTLVGVGKKKIHRSMPAKKTLVDIGFKIALAKK